MEDEKRFHELKSKFFGIRFTDGTIQVHVLESVQEHLEEGVAMHHCVFDNAYYLRENSLILSATIEGRRIETIEVNLDTLKVVQSRGVCNPKHRIPRPNCEPCQCQQTANPSANETNSIKYKP